MIQNTEIGNVQVISRPTPAPVGQRLCRSNQRRISRNGAKMIQASPVPPLPLSQSVGRHVANCDKEESEEEFTCCSQDVYLAI